jgi:uncharacterized membrane protein
MGNSRQLHQKSNAKLNNTYTAKQNIYVGPLPPASEMQKYNNILNGSANRILVMAENDLNSRITDRKTTAITMLLATVLYYTTIILLIVATIILGIHNQAIIAMGTAITALATASPKIITAIKNNKKQ